MVNPDGTLNGDSAGTMGALLMYARRWIQQGVTPDGNILGPGNPNARIYIYEVGGMAGLYGLWNETECARRCYELNCCPNGSYPGVGGVWGSNNGIWMPSGRPILPLAA
jgi:hypothetical protein